MTKDEALRMALEALTLVQIRSEDGEDLTPKKAREAITAIKEALAQPEQKPVGHSDGYWCDDLTCKKCYSADFRFKHKNSVDKESLITPPQRKPLTDEQILALNFDGEFCLITDDDEVILDFARLVESAHGIKE